MTASFDYTSDEVKAVRDAALAGSLAELAAECEQALALTLPLARVPSLQAVIEAWRKQLPAEAQCSL